MVQQNNFNSPRTNTPSLASDIRLKQNISPLDSSQQMQFIKSLKPVQFQWNTVPGLSKKQLGFIAQDVISTGLNFEEIVDSSHNPYLKQHSSLNGFVSPPSTQYSLNYTAFSPILVVVVQHLIQQIEDLQSQVQQLEQRILIQQNDNSPQLYIPSP